MKDLLETACVLLTVLVYVRSVKSDYEVQPRTIHPSDGCKIPQEAVQCITEGGVTIDSLNTDTVAEGAICLFLSHNSSVKVELFCKRHGSTHVWTDTPGLSGDLLIRKRKQASNFAEKFTGVGGTIGTAFGPEGTAIGAAVGAGVGLIADLVCLFICHKPKPPPPNHPPTIQCAHIIGSTTITAEAGKVTAHVQWTNPVATDPDDGKLSVQVIPNSYKSGNQFPEGTYVVSFRAADKQGLSTQCALSFAVKVIRCNPPRWPDNGNVKCTGNTMGSSCNIACHKGYQLEESTSASITCQRGGWSRQTPDCSPKACNTMPTIPNGIIYCPRNKAVYGATCTVVCDDGYKRDGSPFMYCDKNGDWNLSPTCQDKTGPVFDLGSCPNDIQVNIDSSNNTAIVKWDIPTGKDNSGQPPEITERHHYKPGQRMTAGSHTMSYNIVDSNNNQGFPCTFVVQVQTISCQPPSLNVDGSKYMLYNCPNLYRFGATCTLSCRSGYPLGGVDKIQCLNDGSDPPNLSWTWDQNGLKPFCKETQCPDLPAPGNGALACSLWDHGNMCQLQCQQGYDIPLIRDGMYVCGKSDGKWRPDDNVPDCNKKRNAHQMHLKSELYYYTGKCNASAANMMEIKNNFVKALNTSKYHEQCVGVPECKAKFVNVTCGQTTTRRRRSVDTHLTKRSSTRLAYTVTFDILLPFHSDSGKSAATVFSENENILYDMSDSLQKEVDNGHFNMPGRDMTIDNDSFGPGIPEYACPEGSMPKQDSASCSGCPTGRFFSNAEGECQYCPIGTYQDIAFSLDCKSCPPRSNTTHEGATKKELCREYCKAGYHSPTGLSPCVACDSTSFQSSEKSTSCIACEPGKRTKGEGSATKQACQSFDVRLDQHSPFTIKAKSNTSALTLSTWMFLEKRNEYITLLRFNSTDKVTHFAVSGKQNLVFEADWGTIDTGKGLLPRKWYHIVVSIDGTRKSLEAYINGRNVYRNSTLPVRKASLIEAGDSLEIKGGMQLASYNLLSYAASAADVVKWSSSCESTTRGAILTSDTIASSQNTNVILPSMCDAVDECETSPCGRHTCINKQGSYECRCHDGYTGKHCTIKPDFCIDSTCQHGATCVDGASNYTCSCTYGYSGDHCERKAVDGDWSDWTDWTQCSKTCGGGQTSRKRHCNSPSPDPEGVPCQGSSSESRDCNEDKCPECSKLRRSYGVVRNCNTTDTLTRCTVSCRPGLYFTTPPLPYYECGEITGYKWNHQNEENPRARLPACSEVKPPVDMALSLDGHYQTLACSESNKAAVIKSLQAKLTSLECVKESSCETDIVQGSCNNNARKRRSGNTLSVSINLKSTVKTHGTDFSFASVVENKTAPPASLVDFLKQTMALEKSAQQVFNNSVTFFQVTVDGKSQTVSAGASGVSVTPAIRCPSGSVRLDVFCAECPAGSYSDGYKVHLCPVGQYQDETGQAMCKQCPQGKTTEGTGAVDISECEELKTNTGQKGKEDRDESSDKPDGTKIAIGVCVSVAVLALAGAAIVFVYKYTKTRHRRVNDSTLNLQNIYPETYVVPGKTSFQKRAL